MLFEGTTDGSHAETQQPGVRTARSCHHRNAWSLPCNVVGDFDFTVAWDVVGDPGGSAIRNIRGSKRGCEVDGSWAH